MTTIAIQIDRARKARPGCWLNSCLHAIAASIRRFGWSDRRAPVNVVKLAADERVITGLGDLCNGSAIREYYRRCELVIRDGTQRLILDLTRVSKADSKLVACLVLIVRCARASLVPIRIHVSPRLRDWIAICGVERLLLPRVGTPERPSLGDRGAMCAVRK